MIIQDYWFLLNSFTYIAFDNKACLLLYNTQSGKYLESKEKDLIALVQSAREKKNLGVALLSGHLLENDSFNKLITEIIELQIAKIYPLNGLKNKPISLVPVLNLQKDVEKLRKDPSRSIGEDVLSYLTTLNLYINTFCEQTCIYCNSYYKQIFCCRKNGEDREMPIDLISDIIKQVSVSPIGTINILGGNIFKYSEIKNLLNLLAAIDSKIRYWLHYKNIAENIDTPLLQIMECKDVIVNFPIDMDKVNYVIKTLDKEEFALHIIIENAQQYEQYQSLQEHYIEANFQIIPFYNGSNIDFFVENVFLTREDILSRPINQRNIFCNQALNSNDFGSLHIFPTGAVKANPTSDNLGNVRNLSIAELLTVEMDKNTAWRVIRNEKPCNRCLYQYLCPPPSNYETAIGKPNLCHVHP
jgi:pseudo-rSAM protein